MSSMTNDDWQKSQKASKKIIDDARKKRKREVRQAKSLGQTVSYSLATLLEDGHSVDTIRAVFRNDES